MAGKLDGTMCAFKACDRCKEEKWVWLVKGTCADCREGDNMTDRGIEIEQSLAPLTTEAAKALDALRGATIQSTEQRAAFVNYLGEVKGKLRFLDEREKEITRPQNEALKKVREFFAEPKKAFTELESILKAKLAEYETTLALANTAALEAAQVAAANGDSGAARDALVLASQTGATSVSGMQVRHPWEWEIRNVDIVPSQFITIDAKAITAEMRRQLKEQPGAEPFIPGVLFKRGITIAAVGSK